jgi:hypothetical protein
MVQLQLQLGSKKKNSIKISKKNGKDFCHVCPWVCLDNFSRQLTAAVLLFILSDEYHW